MSELWIVVIGVIIFVVPAFFIVSCSSTPGITKGRVVQIDQGTTNMFVIKPTNEMIKNLKDGMRYFRKDGRCYSVVFVQSWGPNALPFYTQISCDDYK